MPKVKSKPGRVRARALHDEAGAHYHQLSYKQRLNWRLTEAALHLQQRGSAVPLVRTLLDFGLLPQATRAEFRLWLGDPLLPPPKPLSPLNQATLDAVRAYRLARVKHSSERAADTAERVLDDEPPEQPGRWRQLGVTAKRLLRIAGGDGSRGYKTISDYEDAAEFYPDLE